MKVPCHKAQENVGTPVKHCHLSDEEKYWKSHVKIIQNELEWYGDGVFNEENDAQAIPEVAKLTCGVDSVGRLPSLFWTAGYDSLLQE